MKVYYSNQFDELASRPKTAIGAIWVFADRQSAEKNSEGSGADIVSVDLPDAVARKMLRDMSMLLTTTVQTREAKDKKDE